MSDCLLEKTHDMFGNEGTHPRMSASYRIKTEETVQGREKGTGQIIAHCDVAGCNVELEIYPDPHRVNRYEVELNSVKAARFVCRSMKEGE
jgi:hypothetical protein